MSWRDQIAKTMADGFKAFHSSPHDFDKFRIDKIGTGEGAQSFGHGAYIAESEKVSGKGGEYYNQFTKKFGGSEGEALRYLKYGGGDRDAAVQLAVKDIADAKRMLESGTYDNGVAFSGSLLKSLPRAISTREQALEKLREAPIIGPRTYEVFAKGAPEKYLDWYKPVGQQGEMQRTMEGLVGTPEVRRSNVDWSGDLVKINNRIAAEVPKGTMSDNPWDHVSGQSAYQALGGFTNPAKASAMLNEAGVPGIRYMDQWSRLYDQRLAKAKDMYETRGSTADYQVLRKLENNPEKTSNAVVFDPDNNLDILKKYGVVGAPAGTIGMGALADQSQYEAPQ